MPYDNKTIFAPISAVGESGITVFRISGPEMFSIISDVFSTSNERFSRVDFQNFATHTSHHGWLWDSGELVDEVILTIFRAPNSYTGEDVTEISSHGGSYIYRKICSLFIKQGIDYAEPGEFSKRAYLNGKMDLAQAEAVAELIKAKTEESNKLALKQLTGEFSKKINELRADLINYCSLLELELDFSEEGIDLVSKNELLSKIDGIIEKFNKLTKSYESGKIIQNGVNLAIVGKPNVGKSTIFNYLLKENRAIVSDIPGTTRDYLQEPLIMEGIQFNVIDTAGIRKSGDIIEEEGVRRSIQKIDESDIVLEIEDLTDLKSSGAELVNDVDTSKIIKIYNKLDLSRNGKMDGLCVSAKTGAKMGELQKIIVKKAKSLMKSDQSSDLIITNQRHRDCLLKSCEFLVNAKEQIKQGGGNELISFEIRAAMDSLSEIIGKTSNVDILNNIFSKFCIGK
ncbi:MAG: tRNA uridine-5-carboxymethylaminomethyl(34) synthesis GTPase MnmE [Chlorobi bacterium]|nr:tRNA uridine-5-carboxymethylaminomethyl(34) synthesis GTPase MnmE [Chlorobiota bacterium]MCI0716586.1 tRNA uridine-5-carboxymethylaminomethyl(34) synthesis GTPase MnmE [Chlorobiota bacterium]